MTARERDAAADELLARIAKIDARGWCPATSGNYSIVVGRSPLELLITRSGADKGRLTRAGLLLVDGEGRPLATETARPSAEVALHTMLARERGAGAVLHTHSIWNTLLGEHFVGERGFVLEGYELLKAFDGVSTHATRLRVPVFPNTQDMEGLASAVAPVLGAEGTAPGFLIAGHGLYAWGPSLDDAVRHLEAFEFLFEVVARRVRLTASTG